MNKKSSRGVGMIVAGRFKEVALHLEKYNFRVGVFPESRLDQGFSIYRSFIVSNSGHMKNRSRSLGISICVSRKLPELLDDTCSKLLELNDVRCLFATPRILILRVSLLSYVLFIVGFHGPTRIMGKRVSTNGGILNCLGPF